MLLPTGLRGRYGPGLLEQSGYVFLKEFDVTAIYTDIWLWDWREFDTLVFSWDHMRPVTDNDDALLRVSRDWGNTFDASDYTFAYHSYTTANAHHQVRSDASTTLVCITNMGPASNVGGAGYTYLQGWNKDNMVTSTFTVEGIRDETGVMWMGEILGMRRNGDAVHACQLKNTAATVWNEAKFSIWGAR